MSPTDDEFDEFDMTEDEFDARAAAGEPVELVATAAEMTPRAPRGQTIRLVVPGLPNIGAVREVTTLVTEELNEEIAA